MAGPLLPLAAGMARVAAVMRKGAKLAKRVPKGGAVAARNLERMQAHETSRAMRGFDRSSKLMQAEHNESLLAFRQEIGTGIDGYSVPGTKGRMAGAAAGLTAVIATLPDMESKRKRKLNYTSPRVNTSRINKQRDR